MELTKEDTLQAKGIAILGMVMLHLFCRLDNLPYTPWIWIGSTPLIYYLGLFGDLCVPIYCFCSGYAHYLLQEKHGSAYRTAILQKLLRFLINYWIVVVLFSAIGLLSGNGSTMPGSIRAFLGNVFLYRISYNGAWWFVLTYVFLSVLSPAFIAVSNKLHPLLTIFLSGIIYFVAYLFRFSFQIAMPNVLLDWMWQQIILLGTSQFGYTVGMVCRRMHWFAMIRAYRQGQPKKLVTSAIILLPVAAFVGHCIVQSAIVAPITAAAVLIFLFSIAQPVWLQRFLLFMGKHSTNIWLVHMFFYLTMFEGFVFVAEYPVLILALMLMVCLCASHLIHWLFNAIQKFINFNL